MKYNLTVAMVRGQGYDGASNMRGNDENRPDLPRGSR